MKCPDCGTFLHLPQGTVHKPECKYALPSQKITGTVGELQRFRITSECMRHDVEGPWVRHEEAAARISQLDVGLEQAKKIIKELLHFADGHELRSREAQLLKGLNVRARDFLLKDKS